MATRMQQRRGTAAQWISTNSGNGPILSPGEIGFESDTNKFKIGDGVNHWVDLTYFTDAESITTALNSIIDGAPAALNTLNELAAALGDNPNFLSGLATETYVDTAVANVEVDLSTAAGTNLEWNAGTSQFDVDTASLLANPTISSGLTLDGTGDFTISADANIILDATTEVYIGSSASGNEVATQSYVDTAVGNVDLSTKQDVVSGVSSTEIGYLDGVTSAIQTQLDAKAPSANPTFTGTVTVPTPTNSTDATTKAYVDAVTEGLHIHASVVAATTENVALSTALENGDTLDGITLATNDRILVKNQTTTSENGIYVVQASGQPVRATDFDTAAEVDSGDFVFVSSGTVNGSTGWVQTNNPATIGTDPIAFTQFSGSGTYVAGTGLTLTGNSFSVNNPVASQSGNSGKYLTTDGTNTSWGTVSGYSAPTLGSTSIASGATVTTIAGLTLSNATLSGSLTAGGGTGTAGQFLQSTGSGVQWAAAGASTTTFTLNSNSATTIDTVALSTFTTIEYTLSIKQGSKIRSSKVFVQTDGTNVDYSEYGIMTTGGIMSGIQVASSASSTNQILQVTISDATSTNATIKFTKTTI